MSFASASLKLIIRKSGHFAYRHCAPPCRNYCRRWWLSGLAILRDDFGSLGNIIYCPVILTVNRMMRTQHVYL